MLSPSRLIPFPLHASLLPRIPTLRLLAEARSEVERGTADRCGAVAKGDVLLAIDGVSILEPWQKQATIAVPWHSHRLTPRSCCSCKPCSKCRQRGLWHSICSRCKRRCRRSLPHPRPRLAHDTLQTRGARLRPCVQSATVIPERF